MRVDNDTANEMVVVLRDKIVTTGPPPKVIRFFSSGGDTLCNIPFYDLVLDTSSNSWFFEDQYGSRVLRSLIAMTGVAHHFEIYDSSLNFVIFGYVSIINAGGDIVFNSLDWEEEQVAIISSLQIEFPTE